MHHLPLAVVPSYPASSYAELERVLGALSGVSPEFQVDLVDGIFVPHRSWPFTEADPYAELARLRAWSPHYTFEFDCMVATPERYLETLLTVPLSRLVIHIGSTAAITSIIAHARTNGYRVGLAAPAGVPLEALTRWIPDIDFVQLMGIAAVGQQGQPFDTRTIARVRQLREAYPDLEIAVDGAVNEATIPSLYAAGVNRFAPGSAITQAKDTVGAYTKLCNLIAH